MPKKVRDRFISSYIIFFHDDTDFWWKTRSAWYQSTLRPTWQCSIRNKAQLAELFDSTTRSLSYRWRSFILGKQDKRSPPCEETMIYWYMIYRFYTCRKAEINKFFSELQFPVTNKMSSRSKFPPTVLDLSLSFHSRHKIRIHRDSIAWYQHRHNVAGRDALFALPERTDTREKLEEESRGLITHREIAVIRSIAGKDRLRQARDETGREMHARYRHFQRNIAA